MATILQDLRFALRQSRRSPAFFLAATLLIAGGVSMSTVAFSLIDAIILRQLPVRDPERLVQLFEIHPRVPARSYFEYGLLRNLREHSSTLAEVVGQMEMTAPITHGRTVERIHPYSVTDDYFRSLGVPSALGRVLTTGDQLVAVLSDAYWRRSFGADPKVIGQTIRLYNRPFTIVGVAPPSFGGTVIDTSADLWIPTRNSYNFLELPSVHVDAEYVNESFTEIVGRLRPGTTLEQAQAEATLFWSRYNREANRRDPTQKPFRDEARLEVRAIARGTSPFRERSSAALLFLLTGTGLLLIMVSSNVGGLLLARASAREKETAVMLAIGAGRSRIARLWFIEGLILATSGGILGTLAAYASLPLVVRGLPPAGGIINPAEIRFRNLSLGVDVRVLAFGLGICALVAVLSGIAPVWRSSRQDLWSALKIALGDRQHQRFQSALCALQVGVCAVLLVCAALAIRSLTTLRNVDAGFDENHIATFRVDVLRGRPGYTEQQAESLQQQLIDGSAALPGVADAAIASFPLMRGIGTGASAVFPDRPPEGRLNTSTNAVSPGYFATMGMRFVAGQGFNRDEAKVSPTPVVINQAFAEHFLPGQNPIGKVFGVGRKWVAPQLQIVGVVSDTKYRSLREVPPPIYYTPDFGPNPQYNTFVLHVRTRGNPESVIPAVRKLLASIDPRMPFYEISTLAEDIDRSLWQERMLSALGTTFGIFSAGLALAGLYGMLAHFVAARRREIGLRLALGATPLDVGRLVANHLLPTIALGLVVGALLSAAAGVWIRSLLYEIRPSDPQAIACALGLISLVVLLAGAMPVWRAVHTDPATSLRDE
ncbi:MAG: ABC transporter permease [Acidobacteria bacterium]|nr:ABC transporter permease [Acidobacteriota bacterium]